MLSLALPVEIYLCTQPTDLRRGFDRLAQAAFENVSPQFPNIAFWSEAGGLGQAARVRAESVGRSICPHVAGAGLETDCD